MKVHAYVLAADPAWVEASVLSYYDLVDRIVVSYDRSFTSWTGAPIAVEESVERLRAIDAASKMELTPGDFARLDHHPLDNDTFQRQTALTAAEDGADWVIQLDTDEVMANPHQFLTCLHEADARGFAALDYPSRLLYQHVRDDLYLEQCQRFWGPAAAYPGPMAVRAGTQLRHCRQTSAPTYRVDFRPRNTDPAHPSDAPVHRVVSTDDAIMHYSWVRSLEHMRAKSLSSGHAGAYDWPREIEHWHRRQSRARITAVTTPLRRAGGRELLRLVRIPGAPDAASRQRDRLSR